MHSFDRGGRNYFVTVTGARMERIVVFELVGGDRRRAFRRGSISIGRSISGFSIAKQHYSESEEVIVAVAAFADVTLLSILDGRDRISVRGSIRVEHSVISSLCLSPFGGTSARSCSNLDCVITTADGGVWAWEGYNSHRLRLLKPPETVQSASTEMPPPVSLWGAHPRLLLFAHESSVYEIDWRSSASTIRLLWSESDHGSMMSEPIVALARLEDSPERFTFVMATEHHIVLLDSRYARRPLLKWRHRLPAICHSLLRAIHVLNGQYLIFATTGKHDASPAAIYAWQVELGTSSPEQHVVGARIAGVIDNLLDDIKVESAGEISRDAAGLEFSAPSDAFSFGPPCPRWSSLPFVFQVFDVVSHKVDALKLFDVQAFGLAAFVGALRFTDPRWANRGIATETESIEDEEDEEQEAGEVQTAGSAARDNDDGGDDIDIEEAQEEGGTDSRDYDSERDLTDDSDGMAVDEAPHGRKRRERTSPSPTRDSGSSAGRPSASADDGDGAASSAKRQATAVSASEPLLLHVLHCSAAGDCFVQVYSLFLSKRQSSSMSVLASNQVSSSAASPPIFGDLEWRSVSSPTTASASGLRESVTVDLSQIVKYMIQPRVGADKAGELRKPVPARNFPPPVCNRMIELTIRCLQGETMEKKRRKKKQQKKQREDETDDAASSESGNRNLPPKTLGEIFSFASYAYNGQPPFTVEEMEGILAEFMESPEKFELFEERIFCTKPVPILRQEGQDFERINTTLYSFAPIAGAMSEVDDELAEDQDREQPASANPTLENLLSSQPTNTSFMSQSQRSILANLLQRVRAPQMAEEEARRKAEDPADQLLSRLKSAWDRNGPNMENEQDIFSQPPVAPTAASSMPAPAKPTTPSKESSATYAAPAAPQSVRRKKVPSEPMPPSLLHSVPPTPTEPKSAAVAASARGPTIKGSRKSSQDHSTGPDDSTTQNTQQLPPVPTEFMAFTPVQPTSQGSSWLQRSGGFGGGSVAGFGTPGDAPLGPSFGSFALNSPGTHVPKFSGFGFGSPAASQQQPSQPPQPFGSQPP